MRPMDRRHLEYFVAVAELGSFTRAAQSLSIAQPSLSHAIGWLERDLGSRLFERHGRGVRLTPAGEALLEPARRSLRSFQLARGAVRAVAEGGFGRLSIITNTLWAVDPLAGLIGGFRAVHPGVQLTVADPARRSDVLDAVRRPRLAARPRLGGLGGGGGLASRRSHCWPSCCCCSPTAGCRRGAGDRSPSPGRGRLPDPVAERRLSPGAVELYYPEVTPPVQLPVAGLADPLFGTLLVSQLGLLGVCAAVAGPAAAARLRGGAPAGQVVRVHGGHGHRGVRDQHPDDRRRVLFPLFGLIPVSVAIAVFKYRLYEIDRLINRTLVYGLLTALLAGVYALGVFVLGDLLDPATGDSALAVAASTLAVAALFQPARRRLQGLVDRRFNRGRYDAAQTVERFSGRLRDQVDLDTLSSELLAVVDHTVQPASASLWLRPAAGTERARVG